MTTKTKRKLLTNRPLTPMFPIMYENEKEPIARSAAVQAEIDKLDIGGDLQNLRQNPNISDSDFIDHLRALMTPCQLRLSWPGSRRAIDEGNKFEMARTISADAELLAVSKKLYDFSNDRWKPVKSIRQRAINTWHRMSIAYAPEPGTRLIRRDLVESFVTEIKALQVELKQAVIQLNEQFSEILKEGEARLGRSYKREDYPDNLLDSFAIEYSFRDIGCAMELHDLNPQLWMDEVARFRENLDEALYRSESVVLEGLAEALETLHGKLKPSENGEKKILRESAVSNITDMIEQFRKTSIGASPKVKVLMDRLNEALKDTNAKYLRQSPTEAARVSQNLEVLKTTIAELRVEDEQAKRIRIAGRQTRRMSFDEAMSNKPS